MRRLSTRPILTPTGFLHIRHWRTRRELFLSAAPPEAHGWRQRSLLALVYAKNVFATIDRRMPEARGLAGWLAENVTVFGLDDIAVLDPWDGLGRSRRGGVTAEDWLNIKAALDMAMRAPSRSPEAPIACWVAELTRVLQLDEVSSRTPSLALHNKSNKRVAGLLDVVSECRGGCRRFSRDVRLLGLLLDAPSAPIAKCLTASAKLRAAVTMIGNEVGLDNGRKQLRQTGRGHPAICRSPVRGGAHIEGYAQSRKATATDFQHLLRTWPCVSGGLDSFGLAGILA